MKSETAVPTETCLHHNISDRAVARRVSCAESRTTAGRGEVDLCVYNIDAWCSHAVTILLLLIPYTPRQIHMMRYLFMYI